MQFIVGLRFYYHYFQVS